MNLDKVCTAAKKIIEVIEGLELTKDEATQAGVLANAELYERYFTELEKRGKEQV